ncbi:MAG: hypothetical protein JSV80_10125 [Acidobacteriota bacterium]|nr:MAG: hypothetical protein JSV80_10125 [Acidobacteriota bacterium]
MKPRLIRRHVLWLGLAAVWAGALPAGFAEVSAERHDPNHPDAREDSFAGFVMISAGGSGDDPTPWPSWQLQRQTLNRRQVLNLNGDLNGDGQPAFALHPVSALADVIWAWFDGNDYEIVISRWTGTEWTAWRQLTDNEIDDLDPRVTFDRQGSRRIVWWRPALIDSDAIWYSEQLDVASDLWSEPERITPYPDTGQRPDIAVHQNADEIVAWAAYEVLQPASASPRRVLVAERTASGWLSQRIGPSPTADLGPVNGDLAVRLHSRNGKLWVEWIDGQAAMAYSVYEPAAASWSDPSTIDYSDERQLAGNEEIAREMARQRIRQRVLADATPATDPGS